VSPDGRSLRAQAQRAQRRNQVLAAALRVFSERGFHGASVSQIVETAGVARGTFYQYFANKKAIFLELLDNLLAELRGSVQGVDPTANTPIPEQLVAAIARIFAVVLANRSLTQIVFREAVGLDADVDAKLRLFDEGLAQYIRAALALGQRTGLVRELDREVAATCVVGTLRYIAQRSLVEDEHPDVHQLASEVVAFNLRGVLNEKKRG